MRTIIVYGGAFNPPTIAHQRILQATIDWVSTKDNSEVWVLPSGENNKKKTGIPRQKRLDYCQALIESVSRGNVLVRTELLELDGTTSTNKVETVTTLVRQNPDATFWWVYGADSIETIDRWGGEWLKSNTHMLIAPRDDAVIDIIPSGSELLEVNTTGCPSSTNVRSRIAKNESYQDVVPPKVMEMIDRSLYQPK